MFDEKLFLKFTRIIYGHYFAMLHWRAFCPGHTSLSFIRQKVGKHLSPPTRSCSWTGMQHRQNLSINTMVSHSRTGTVVPYLEASTPVGPLKLIPNDMCHQSMGFSFFFCLLNIAPAGHSFDIYWLWTWWDVKENSNL